MSPNLPSAPPWTGVLGHGLSIKFILWTLSSIPSNKHGKPAVPSSAPPAGARGCSSAEGRWAGSRGFAGLLLCNPSARGADPCSQAAEHTRIPQRAAPWSLALSQPFPVAPSIPAQPWGCCRMHSTAPCAAQSPARLWPQAPLESHFFYCPEGVHCSVLESQDPAEGAPQVQPVPRTVLTARMCPSLVALGSLPR